MSHVIVALISGLLFALGLGVAGMTDPTRVLAFLELRDPALLLTLAGAAGVTFFGFPRVLRRPRPLLASRFWLPTRNDVDARLVGGAALFGVGWGLAGLCPGPALVDLAAGGGDVAVFVVSMLVGGVTARTLLDRRMS